MDETARLDEELGLPRSVVGPLDEAVRSGIAQHLTAEMRVVVGEMQKLVDVVSGLGLAMADELQEAVAELSESGSAEETGAMFLSALAVRAKSSVQALLSQMKASSRAEGKDSFPHKMVGSLSREVSSAVVRSSSAEALETALLAEVGKVADLLKQDNVASQLSSDLSAHIHRLFLDHKEFIQGLAPPKRVWQE